MFDSFTIIMTPKKKDVIGYEVHPNMRFLRTKVEKTKPKKANVKSGYIPGKIGLYVEGNGVYESRFGGPGREIGFVKDGIAYKSNSIGGRAHVIGTVEYYKNS